MDEAAPAAQQRSQRVPLSRMRRAITAAMNLSAQVPQFTLDRTIALAAAAALRSDLRAEGLAISWEDILAAASARALREHPGVNASFDGDAILRHEDINVGLATALEEGLVSPAILNADRRSLREIAQARRALRERAAAGGLHGSELYGATFTLSNLGPYGIERFRALVIPPQAAILASGRVLGPDDASRINVSLSCDHRVIDGAPAAQFLATVCDLIEQPDWLRQIAGQGPDRPAADASGG